MHPQLLDRPDGTAAREHTGAAQDAAPAAQHTARLSTTRPTLGSRLSRDADREDPRISEGNRGGAMAGGVARRRWLLRRR